jgi:hypothetical protein
MKEVPAKPAGMTPAKHPESEIQKENCISRTIGKSRYVVKLPVNAAQKRQCASPLVGSS